MNGLWTATVVLGVLPGVGESVPLRVQVGLHFQCHLRRSASGCGELAKVYDPWFAHPATVDPQRALETLDLACRRGHPSSCAQQGRFLDSRYPHPGLDNDDPGAIYLYRKACEAGVGEACTDLGNMYSLQMPWGMTGAQRARSSGDMETAAELWLRACTLDEPQACRALGRLHGPDPLPFSEGFEPDEERAQGLLAKADAIASSRCESGDLESCGEILLRGLPLDDSETVAASVLEAWTRAALEADAFGLYSVSAGHALMPWGMEAIEVDPATAAEHFSRACEQGNGAACRHLGTLHDPRFELPGLEKDRALAEKSHARACELGVGVSCEALGSLLDAGPEALELFTRACELGTEAGCTRAGMLLDTGYSQGAIEPENSLAAGFYEKGCELQSSWSCMHLGILYDSWYFRPGVGPDDSMAWSHYSRACDLGNGEGCNNLGWLHDTGYQREGFEQDNLVAGGHYLQACELDSATGCANLGMLYDSVYMRPDFEKDDVLAYKYYDRGCDLGSAKGCYNLGTFNDTVFDTPGIEETNQSAVEYYRIGCEEGLAEDCYNLGALLDGAYRHPGLSYDRAQAREAFQRACKLGLEGACR